MTDSSVSQRTTGNPVAVCYWLPDGTITYASPSYVELLGLSEQAVVGRRWPDLVPATEHDVDRQEVLKRTLGEFQRYNRSPHAPIATGRNDSGSIGWVEWPARDALGNVTAVYSFAFESADSGPSTSQRPESLVAASEVGEYLHNAALQQLVAALWALSAEDFEAATGLVQEALTATSISVRSLTTASAELQPQGHGHGNGLEQSAQHEPHPPTWPYDLTEHDLLTLPGYAAAQTAEVSFVVGAGELVVWANSTATKEFSLRSPVTISEAFDSATATVLRNLLKKATSPDPATPAPDCTSTTISGRTFGWHAIDRRSDPSVAGVILFGNDQSYGRAALLRAASTRPLLPSIGTTATPILVVDESANLVAHNTAAHDLFHPLDVPVGWKTIRHPDTLLLSHFDVNIVKPGLRPIRVRQVAIPAVLDNSADGFLVALTDVTTESERRGHVYQLVNQWRNLLQELPHAVFLVRASGCVAFANTAARTILGAEHTATQIDFEFILGCTESTEDRSLLSSAVAHALGPSEAIVAETITVRGQAGTRLLEVVVSPMALDAERVALVVATDVTAERQESALVSELNQELNAKIADIQRARVAEREAVSRELHDSTLQRLTALRWVLRTGPGNTEAVGDLDEVIAELRELVSELHASVDGGGLQLALTRLAGTVQTPCTLHVTGDYGPVTGPRAEVAFRAIREAVRNVDRHADASTVKVNVEIGPVSIYASVIDDGIGVDLQKVSAASRAGHIGILSVRESVLDSGGTFQLTGTPGKGTKLELELPR